MAIVININNIVIEYGIDTIVLIVHARHELDKY
jgi:hypothetical protein